MSKGFERQYSRLAPKSISSDTALFWFELCSQLLCCYMICIPLYLFLSFHNLRPGNVHVEMNVLRKKKKKRIRACCRSDNRGERFAADSEKASVGSVPFVTVNNNKCCFRIASLTNWSMNFSNHGILDRSAHAPSRSCHLEVKNRIETLCVSSPVWINGTQVIRSSLSFYFYIWSNLFV